MKTNPTRNSSTASGRLALALACLGGIAGIAVAVAGYAAAGVAVCLACGAGGYLLLRGGGGEDSPESIKNFLERHADEGEGAASAAAELRALLEKVDARGEAIRNVVRYLQEHATLVAWLIDNFGNAAVEANEQLGKIRVSAAEVSARGGQVLEGSRRGQAFVDGIGKSAKALAGDADSLAVFSENTRAMVKELQDAHRNAEAALRKLAEVSDHSTNFISEVGTTMGSIRESTQNSLDLFNNVEEYSKRGRQVVGMVGHGVEEIRRSTEETLTRINQLSVQSRQIEEVLGIINDVADETSLLALNAAILAAQAGERGAAFAVVADQIRSLAHRTRVSIEHIENIVRSVQKQIKEANEKMSVSVEAVNQGLALGNEAVGQLDLIEHAVSEAFDQARSVAQLVEKQDNMSAQMVAISTEMNMELHGVAAILRQSSTQMDSMGELITEVSGLSASVRTAADSNMRSALDVNDIMNTFVAQVEEIETLVDKQQGAVNAMDSAMSSVSESAEASRESLNSIHTIVNELVEHSDGLREEVVGAGYERSSDKETGGVPAYEGA